MLHRPRPLFPLAANLGTGIAARGKRGRKMNDFSLQQLKKITELYGQGDYIGSVDWAISLLNRPQSLLYQGLQRLNYYPEQVKEVCLRFRPVFDRHKDKNTPLSPSILSPSMTKKVALWEEKGVTDEKSITFALLEGANALTYALSIKGIAIDGLKEAMETAWEVGPVRINTPCLNKYGTDLTQLARRGKLSPCIGRDREIRQTASILHRMNKNMPVLVGDPGVGKTAVIEGFAQYLISQDSPEDLRHYSIIDFPISGLVAGKIYLGEVEEFVQKLIDELRRNPDVILFLDEIHQIIGTGSTKNKDSDVAQLFKPALARGEIKIIGATTFNEYKILEKDPAFERRMNPVQVDEPSQELALEMVRGAKSRYEQHHHIKIEDEALVTAVKLAKDYLTYRKLPDTAFDLIDLTCANAKTFTDCQAIAQRALCAIATSDIVKTLVEMTGIDLLDLQVSMEDRLNRVENALSEQVIGQNQAVSRIMERLMLAHGGLGRRDRPLGVFLFMGAPGSGKTLLAKMLAKYLFGDDKKMLRLDMGEYKDESSVTRIIGSSPGYIGYEEGGKLTEFVKNNPFSILLFDEVEKAHYRVTDVFLSLCGEGHITDGQGRKIDARNTLVIMTSNIGSEILAKGGGNLGFDFGNNQADSEFNRLQSVIREQLPQFFRPEFVNRIDEIIIFRSLEQSDFEAISRLQVKRISDRLADFGTIMTVETQVYQLLAKEAVKMKSGARPLERIIDEMILLPLSRMRINHQLKTGDKVYCEVVNDQIQMRKEI
jgi:ATP-dependent Clp protease ATP-binding subunit ClpC